MANEQPIDKQRLLVEIYKAAVGAAHPAVCVPPHLPAVPADGRILIVGAGKAASAMVAAAEKHYAAYAALGTRDRVVGFVSTRHGSKLPTEGIEIIEAAHPVPDEMSRAGAERALAAVAGAGPNDLVLCLLSGGASALWSAPVEGVGLDAKQALTKQLLRSGARITEMNCVRRHLSRIKGGKLAAAAHPARLITLAISDVPGDEPASIGSGPTVADPTTLAEAREVLTRYGIEPPPAIAAALDNPANETVKPGDPRLANSTYTLVATPKGSLAAAADAARKAGYRVDVLGDSLEGEARDVARFHAAMALHAKRRGERVAFLSGGELTVTIRGNGSGGPNQEYALALAIALDGEAGVNALAADTDGIDGGGGNPDDPAGAVIDPGTLARARERNLNAAAFLENNDSTGFFTKVGGLLQCGSTQTNVNDLRVILVDP